MLVTIVRSIIIVVCAAGLGAFSGCKSHITGNGPQPSYIEESEHEPRLNIFGVLRPGRENGLPLSFVHVERSIAYVDGDLDDLTTAVEDVQMMLFYHKDGLVVDSTSFYYTSFDSVFERSEYRPVSDFSPTAGQTYGLACRKEGFPTLTATTTVPQVPTIVANSLVLKAGELAFTIERDPLAALYDAYLMVGDQQYVARERRPESGDTGVVIPFDNPRGSEGSLVIYAYDLNLSEYTTFNIYVKPQTFQPPFSTVDNGFGCFGSLNSLEIKMSF